MKTTTVVEFSKKEIQDMLLEEAKRKLNINGASTSQFAFQIATGGKDVDAELTAATITFDNLQTKGK
jgi:hypothetical protein